MNADMVTDQYSYRVQWSKEDNEYVGTCDELPGLSWLDELSAQALAGIRKVVGEAVADMRANGMDLPVAKQNHAGNHPMNSDPRIA